MNDQVRMDFARLAKEWADTKVPYQHRGMTRQGCDCTGLLIGIARELGYLQNYKLRQYPPDWNLHAGAGNHVIEELGRYADPIPNSKAESGDIAVMRFGKCPAHAGIIIGADLMVHALSTSGCCRYAKLCNSTWSRRWMATYRWNLGKLNNGGCGKSNA